MNMAQKAEWAEVNLEKFKKEKEQRLAEERALESASREVMQKQGSQSPPQTEKEEAQTFQAPQPKEAPFQAPEEAKPQKMNWYEMDDDSVQEVPIPGVNQPQERTSQSREQANVQFNRKEPSPLKQKTPESHEVLQEQLSSNSEGHAPAKALQVEKETPKPQPKVFSYADIAKSRSNGSNGIVRKIPGRR